jgi:hypothetical protein
MKAKILKIVYGLEVVLGRCLGLLNSHRSRRGKGHIRVWHKKVQGT